MNEGVFMEKEKIEIMWPYQNRNLLQVSHSILKEMGILPVGETLKELDKKFEEKEYTNVVVILYDGMGTSVLNRYLPQNAFLQQHKICDISSVFPATTVAATTSLLTGLSPSEHGWLGWDMYFKDDNETVSVYKDTLKDSDIPARRISKNRPEMQYETILDKIKNVSKDAYFVWPFDETQPCNTLEQISERIYELCQKPNKKFIYAYYEYPDKMMHKEGLESKNVADEMEKINAMTEKLYQKMPENSIVIVVADHGHIACEYKTLSDYPQLYDMLERTTAIETRALSMKLKKDVSKELFEKLFLQEFQEEFKLYRKDEVIQQKLFGSHIKNETVMDNFADYLAVAISNVCLRYDEKGKILKTAHAGISKQEMLVPLIVMNK